ncbi:MAG: hypothetical protein SFY67_02355 [Candidatus Melainabacteria bacterium]|nr:hypothetical protein [Candidatus Melainabacteria bacterium]
MKRKIITLLIVALFLSTAPAHSEARDGDLFDNMGMDLMLHDAERLADEHEYERSKQKWSRVIQFMHSPNWFATAAVVPICLKFARLADRNLARSEDADADQLLRASFDFPFHKRGEEVQVDAVAVKLLDTYKKKNQTDQCKQFLQYAISKTSGQRQFEYKAKLDAMTQVVSQEPAPDTPHIASPDSPPINAPAVK